MKAIRIHGRGGPDHLFYEDAPRPQPDAGEVLVRVYAAGVIAHELQYDETYRTSAGVPRPLPIPGHDVAGVVEELGSGVTTLTQGEEVFALTAFDRDGSEAEYMLALPDELAPKPRSIDFVHAAAIPLSALTAWQALFEHANLVAGQTILIHGASGGVGVMAVQLARWKGAHVIATASIRNQDFVRQLGASEVIDYTTTRFEDVVQNVDVVFDMIGGDTLQRSLQVVKPEGVIVSVVSPRPTFDEARQRGVRFEWFIVEPNGEQLTRMSELIDAGHLQPVLDTVLPLSEARKAYEQGVKGHARGKIVLRVRNE